ncbi:flagellar basal body P-ring protein FlgI [Magnetospirillum moscoviense]|uniref:Flagellar P-ring protein n=1 Tax=Magnetospirillum moscoviense TaxID=1437059 RepID=A0A178MQ77_9PROT|nr:flagellar basal body P-ring protein FlgI [Magnetospirillum moscoviense]MBF0324010.1 flagellar basal body P-ring protein FlgI [Alphaproteobacteria bacterium]OAN50771.1 flagellar biosynthesis protein FlgA [Magnetospirillum moscoviense]
MKPLFSTQTVFAIGMRAFLLAAGLVGLTVFAMPQTALGASRIKDIADFEGVRENMLVGYGIVVGLNGTGDDLTNSPFTKESLVGMLERLGVNIREQGGTIATVKPKNVAAVMVTAVLPPFARQGTRIDVSVSALGDAKSLLGGTLLVTPLVGADGEIYAVAQGGLAGVGVTATGASGSSVTKGVPTSGKIANAAIVERELPFEMGHLESVKVTLRNPDFTTARRVAQAVNSYLGTDIARPSDPGTIQVTVPPAYRGNVVAMLTDIEQLRIEPDQIAKIVIDEASGTIVMGENVRISTVAIAQGQLTIRITETPQVSQPSPFSTVGTTTTVQRSDIEIDEGSQKKLSVLPHGVTLQELVNGLNSLGIGPRDLISILQAIKAAGALQADIEVM